MKPPLLPNPETILALGIATVAAVFFFRDVGHATQTFQQVMSISGLLESTQTHLLLHLIGICLGAFLTVVSVKAFLSDRRRVLLLLVGAFVLITLRDLVAFISVMIYQNDFVLPLTEIESGHAFDIVITGLLAISTLRR